MFWLMILGWFAQDCPLAVFTGGEVTREEFLREQRFLSQAERHLRQDRQQSPAQQSIDWLRRIALREIAASIAFEQGFLQDPVVREKIRQQQRNWLLQAWADDDYGMGKMPLDEAVVREELMGRKLRIPDRLRLSHIFMRAEGPQQEAAVRHRLERLRKEIDSLETFKAKARSHSDSQTARRGGPLGFMRRGRLPEEAEAVLYQLPEGSISPPIKLRGGYHIFYIEKFSPAHEVPMARRLQREIAKRRAEYRETCRQNMLAAASKKISVEIKAGPGDDWPHMWVGNWSVPGHVLAAVYQQPQPSAFIQQLKENELLFQTALESDWLGQDKRLRLKDLKGNVLLLEMVARATVDEMGEPEEPQLRALIAANPKKYRKRRALQLRVLRITIPRTGNPLVFYDRCADLAEQLRHGATNWRQAAETLGGVVETWPFTDSLHLAARLGPPVFSAINQLPVGTVTEPLQDLDTLWVIQVQGEQPPRPLRWQEAKPRAVAMWRAQRAEELEVRFLNDLLHRYQFKILPEEGEKP